MLRNAAAPADGVNSGERASVAPTTANFQMGLPKKPGETFPAAAWPIDRIDPLTDALLFLAAHHGRALSREALLAGLPIEGGKLSVQLFERAAERAGLESVLERRPVSDIPGLVLPAVLIMRDGTTRILVATDQRAGVATMVN